MGQDNDWSLVHFRNIQGIQQKIDDEQISEMSVTLASEAEALKSPNHRKYFNFPLGCWMHIQNFPKAWQYWCGQAEVVQDGQK